MKAEEFRQVVKNCKTADEFIRAVVLISEKIEELPLDERRAIDWIITTHEKRFGLDDEIKTISN